MRGPAAPLHACSGPFVPRAFSARPPSAGGGADEVDHLALRALAVRARRTTQPTTHTGPRQGNPPPKSLGAEAGIRPAGAQSRYVLAHEEEFRPFVDTSAEEGGGGGGGDAFQRYCSEMEHSAVWGGELELRALCGALRRPISVFAAHLPAVLAMGQEHGGEPLRIAFLLHSFGLGEHYNSLVPAASS